MSQRPDLGYRDEGQDLADWAFYADAVGGPGEPRTLPPAAFRSLAFTRLEDEAVWTRDWICVGSHQQVPEIGDLLPFTIGTHGVHVQRTADGLAARFNKAQHGGCRMVPLQCQTGTKTKCSFTSCGYSRDRGAIPASELGDGTPEMHQYLGLRPERLLTAHVRSWGPLIFVNLDVSTRLEGTSFDAPASAGGVFGRQVVFGNHKNTFFGNHKPIRSEELWLEYPANWKLLGQRLAGGAPVDLDEAAGWIVADTTLSDGSPARTAWLFPNLVLIATERETAVLVLQQTAIGKTLCRLSVYGQQGYNDLRGWKAEVDGRAAAAVVEHVALARWGTSFRTETIAARLPVQSDPHGVWMQRTLARRVARMPRGDLDQPLFTITRG